MIQILGITIICVFALAFITIICRSVIAIRNISLEKLEEQNDFERNKPSYNCKHKYLIIDTTKFYDGNASNPSYKKITYQCNNCGDIKTIRI